MNGAGGNHQQQQQQQQRLRQQQQQQALLMQQALQQQQQYQSGVLAAAAAAAMTQMEPISNGNLPPGIAYNIPRDEEGEPLYEDFICPKCSPQCYFLKLYPDTIWASNKQSSAPQAETTNSTVMNGNSSLGNIDKSENGALINHLNCEKTSDNENCPKDSVAPEKASLDDSSDGKCKLGMNISSNTPSADSENKMPFFMSKGWREVICRCETCTGFYAQQGVAYLIDKEDSIEEYEKVAKQKREKKLEQQEGVEANFLNSLDHVQKIEILSGINDMKNELQSFLETFDSSKPVTSEDIRAVFENLAKKKKQRLS
uniref:Uncharacterized protein n=1 Tax=Oryza meridionalis TaxID=40149 RepID=A0A0E0E2I2_9ORYZ